jgi:hypothetical protein
MDVLLMTKIELRFWTNGNDNGDSDGNGDGNNDSNNSGS